MSPFNVALLVAVSWALWMVLWMLLPVWLHGRKPTAAEIWWCGFAAVTGVLLFLAVILWQAMP